MSTCRRALRWLGGLLASWGVLVMATPGAVSTVATDVVVDPVKVAAAMTWTIAAVLLTSLTFGTAIACAGALVRSPALVAMAPRLTLPGLRNLLHRGLCTGLLTSALLGSTGVAAQDRPPSLAPPSLEVMGPEASDEPPIMVMVQPEPADPTPMIVDDDADRSSEPAASSTWTVERGEHLWHIARTVIIDRTGSQPTNEQIATYHQELIEANRHNLVDSANPDLIYPGQQFNLP